MIARRRLTADQFRKRMTERAALVEDFGKRHAKARRPERDRLLLSAFILCCDRLPGWMSDALFPLLQERLPQTPPEDWLRHDVFRYFLDLRDDDGNFRHGWKEALRLTVELFAKLAESKRGKPAEERTIIRHYLAIEAILPEKARRPLTWINHRRRPLVPK
jgi:hypothetical protein